MKECGVVGGGGRRAGAAVTSRQSSLREGHAQECLELLRLIAGQPQSEGRRLRIAERRSTGGRIEPQILHPYVLAAQQDERPLDNVGELRRYLATAPGRGRPWPQA